MSAVYDNWERLVAATLKRQQYRELALAPSRESSFSSSTHFSRESSFTSSFSTSVPIDLPRSYSRYSFVFFHTSQGSGINDTRDIEEAIRLAKDVKWDPAATEKIKITAAHLASLLKEVKSMINMLYDRPTKRIIKDTLRTLNNDVKRLNKTITLTNPFPVILLHLEQSIEDFSWLLGGSEYVGFPPIVLNEPMLCWLWELIAVVCTGSPDDQCQAAETLGSLSLEDDLYLMLIVEEGLGQTLVDLLKYGNLAEKKNAARAIGLLGKNRPGLIEEFFGVADWTPVKEYDLKF